MTARDHTYSTLGHAILPEMATFGSALRRTREQRRISLDEIAKETRLSKRYLVALEDEAISKLPGGTYNRAYLRTYATFLGLNPDALVRDYVETESRLTQTAEQDQLAAMNRALERRGAIIGESSAASSIVKGLGGNAGRAVVALTGLATLVGMVWFGLSGFDRAAAPVLEVPAGVPAVSGPAGEAPAPLPTANLMPPASAEVPGPVESPSASPAAEAPDADAAPPVTASDGVRALPDNIPPTTTADPDPNPGMVIGRGSSPAPEVPPTTDAAPSHLTVAGSGVGTAVVDRQLVGQADRFSAGSRVVFWTHVRGGRAGDTIDHVWLRDGTVVGAASLAVGSPDWRTQSRRLLDPPGVWVVEARDPEGHVLARHRFHAADE